MLLTYLWQARDASAPAASQHFSDVLAREQDRYAGAWGRTPELSTWSHGNLFLGQLRYDPGVEGFEAWVDHDAQGLAWGGICESFLGARFSPERVAEIIDISGRRPGELVTWDGRFSLSCWDRAAGRVTLATGATQSPTLWYTEGPDGWAVSSRAAPALELAGRPKVPNREAIDLFLVSGYLIGNGHLFDGVERVPSRRVLTFDGRGPPRSIVYAGPLDVLRAEEHPSNRNAAIEVCRDRLIRRVGLQHRSSTDPILLLTGGRDSRLIAAAARRAGYEGNAHSGGSPRSPDVRVAGMVASALELKRHPGWGEGYFPAGITPIFSLDHLKLWSRHSEGIETIRQGLTWRDFFARSLPCPAHREVSFHGLAGEFGKGAQYRAFTLRTLRKEGANSFARAHMRSRTLAFWRDRRPRAGDLLDATYDRFEHDVGGTVTLAVWLELFSWQRRVLHWGEDLMLVRSPISWTWTPLHDRTLFGVYLALAPEEKYGSRFVEELTVAIAPELGGVPYGQAEHGAPGVHRALRDARKALGRVKRRLTSRGRHSSPDSDGKRENQERQEFWNTVFRAGDEGSWRDLVSERDLRTLIDREPNSEALWNLATVELFMRANF